jgi:S-DNA-T family DNA segregation ATPase FtsK/SpoIIIE
MTAKKKKKSRQLTLRLGLNDERIPKLLGMLLLFLALYLTIAFTSHLFTWREDQNAFYPFSWEKLLSSDLVVANWLGRLGAAISNMFFYWWFGLPSFVFVYLLIRFGTAFFKREQSVWRRYLPMFRTSILFMLFLSILLEFALGESEFPWGGAFGESVSIWMRQFVGTAGMIAFFAFSLLGFIIWTFNPNLHEMTPRQMAKETGNFFSDLLKGQWVKKESYSRMKTRQMNEKATTKSLSAEDEKSEKVSVLKPGDAKKESEETPQTEKEQQLTFQLDESEKQKKKQDAAASKAGSTELEIEAPQPEASSTDEDEGPPTSLFPKKEEDDPLVNQEPYDPTMELSSYEHPVVALLEEYSDQKVEIDRAELEANKDQIIETLLNYKIEITKIKATIGPTVTLYEIVPAPGVRISRIKNLEDDIALSLAALGIRIIAPIPGKGTIGIEVPNKNKQIVSLREVLISEKFKRAKMELPIALGKTISNEVFVADLAKMPHLLIAGATGQGKSVGINTVLMSLLYKKHPSEVKFVLIDPKKVELFPYSHLEHHFLAYLPNLDEPIVTDTTKVVHTFNSLLIEMEQRYTLLKKAHARNIKEYNAKFTARRLNPEKGHQYMPHIILVIDEFADLIMTAGKEIELPIGRLAQLSRAVGIHLIIATQRPSVNIITGVIKANFPARIGFKVTSKVDSRTILDQGGADRLIGRGDMLLSFGSEIVRLQCAFVDTPEVERVIEFISSQPGYPTPFFLPEYLGDDADHDDGSFNIKDIDEMFPDAARLIVQNQHGSTSMIQRRLRLGYNRAGRIMDQLEALGIVGPNEGSKAREVLIFDEMELERYLEEILNKKLSS